MNYSIRLSLIHILNKKLEKLDQNNEELKKQIKEDLELLNNKMENNREALEKKSEELKRQIKKDLDVLNDKIENNCETLQKQLKERCV